MVDTELKVDSLRGLMRARAPRSQEKQMPDEPVVIKTFDNGVEADMAQQMLADAGVRAFVLKDDAGGMEPHLQLTGGVRLVVGSADAERAREVLGQMISD